MPAQALLFDIDGTLVEPVDLHARAWQEAFAHFGKRVEFRAVRSQIGKGGVALRRLGPGVEKARVYVIGDSPWDAVAAGWLGVRTIGVLCGGFPEADLRKAGCVAIYRDPADLSSRLDESPIVR